MFTTSVDSLKWFLREEGIQVRACRQLSSLLPLLTGCGQPQRLLYRIQEPARAVQEQLRYVLFLAGIPSFQSSTSRSCI